MEREATDLERVRYSASPPSPSVYQEAQLLMKIRNPNMFAGEGSFEQLIEFKIFKEQNKLHNQCYVLNNLFT